MSSQAVVANDVAVLVVAPANSVAILSPAAANGAAMMVLVPPTLPSLSVDNHDGVLLVGKE